MQQLPIVRLSALMKIADMVMNLEFSIRCERTSRRLWILLESSRPWRAALKMRFTLYFFNLISQISEVSSGFWVSPIHRNDSMNPTNMKLREYFIVLGWWQMLVTRRNFYRQRSRDHFYFIYLHFKPRLL